MREVIVQDPISVTLAWAQESCLGEGNLSMVRHRCHEVVNGRWVGNTKTWPSAMFQYQSLAKLPIVNNKPFQNHTNL